MKKIVVVGAGLAGLTAAYRLRQYGYDITVLEAAKQVGGRAQTTERNGYVINTAAGAISEAYVSYRALVKELGAQDIIEPANPEMGTVRDGVIHHISSANILSSGLGSKLISWRSKLTLVKLLIDVWRAKRKGMLNFADIDRAAQLDFETASDYAKRRLNSELDDYICDPLTRTIVLTDSTKISKVELFSGFANISSVTLYGIRGGVNRVPRLIAEHLKVKTECPVSMVEETDGGVKVQWQAGDNTHIEDFDACVFACTLPAAVALSPKNKPLQSLANKLKYSQAITVAVGVTKATMTKASVVQVPSKESPDVCLFLLGHNIIKSSVPVGHGLLVVYWEADASSALMDATDEEIEQRTLAVVARLFPEVIECVDMVHISRLPVAAPLTRVGTYESMRAFNQAASTESHIQYCGDYMSAFSQETAVEQGNRAAERMIKSLQR